MLSNPILRLNNLWGKLHWPNSVWILLPVQVKDALIRLLGDTLKLKELFPYFAGEQKIPPPPKDLCLLFFYIYKYWFRLYLKYGSIGVFWKFEILFFYLKLFFLFFQNRNWYHIHKYIFKHLKIFKPIKKIWQVQCFLYQLHILGFGRSEKKTR